MVDDHVVKRAFDCAVAWSKASKAAQYVHDLSRAYPPCKLLTLGIVLTLVDNVADFVRRLTVIVAYFERFVAAYPFGKEFQVRLA
jgi:hypothetical protein